MARQFTRRSRSRTRWGLFTHSFLAHAAGSVAATVFSAGSVEETILRVRGNLLAQFDGTLAPGRGVQVGVGLIIMPEGQGATVVSSSLSDGNAPWFWLETFDLYYEEAVTDVIAMPWGSSFRQTIDSKGMRILRPDREVQLVVEQATTQAAAAINLSVSARMLIQHSG